MFLHFNRGKTLWLRFGSFGNPRFETGFALPKTEKASVCLLNSSSLFFACHARSVPIPPAKERSYNFHTLWLEKIFFFKGQRCPGVSFQRIGCYKEKTQKGRPLSDLLFTDRKSSSSKWSGLKYAFQEFNAYLPDLACRCAKATKFKGYTVFGLTNYGKNDSLNRILTLNTRPLCLFSKHQPVIGSR